MKKLSALFVFTFLSFILYGQSPFTLNIEFPDHAADGSYVTIARRSVPGDFSYYSMDSLLVENKRVYYEGMTLEKPFYAQLYFEDKDIALPSYFIIEPGDIQLTITDWKEKGIPSGTPINDEYAKYVKQDNLAINIKKPWETKREEGFASKTWTEEDEKEYRSVNLRKEYQEARKLKLEFMEKYTSFPDIIRGMLFPYLTHEITQKQIQHILDQLPEDARDTLYARQAQFHS